jgi:hypothetical protein
MSVLPKTIRRLASPLSASLSRLLLRCRFDFRQKTWELPGGRGARDDSAIFPADAVDLVSAVFQTFSEFSDPATGGAKTARTANRRIDFRPSVRAWKKPKQSNKGKK